MEELTSDERQFVEEGEPFSAHLGERLRRIRKSKGMTLTQLSMYTSSSLGYLSNLESGLRSPTVDRLSIICDALGVSLVSVLEDRGDTRTLVRRDHNRVRSLDDIALEWRTVDFGGGFEPFDILTLGPGADRADSAAVHPFDECCYVFEGELTVIDEGKRVTLRTGDSYLVKANNNHVQFNESDKRSVSIWFRAHQI